MSELLDCVVCYHNHSGLLNSSGESPCMFWGVSHKSLVCVQNIKSPTAYDTREPGQETVNVWFLPKFNPWWWKRHSRHYFMYGQGPEYFQLLWSEGFLCLLPNGIRRCWWARMGWPAHPSEQKAKVLRCQGEREHGVSNWGPAKSER